MSDFKSIDSSKTMEDLRAVRSYNDLVILLSAIKNSTDAITNRLHRKPTVSSLLQDINLLEQYSYGIQYSKTLTIASDKKNEKFKTLSASIENAVNTSIAQAYFALNAIGESTEPPLLQELATLVSMYLSKTLNIKKYTSIVIPLSETSFRHYFIMQNLRNANNYILNEFIVALDWENYDGVETTTVSFPAKMMFDADKVTISKRTLIKTITECLSRDTLGILGMSDSQKETLDRLKNVKCSYVADGCLNVELESGIAPMDINVVLTKLLPELFVALNIQDPRRDIIHRVTTTENGNKCIRIALTDRNFSESKSLLRIKRALSLDAANYKQLLQLASLSVGK